MALGSQRISGRFQVKNVTLNIYLHSQTFLDLDQLTSRIYFKTNAYSFHTHLLYLCWVMNKIPDLHEHWVILQEESSLSRGVGQIPPRPKTCQCLPSLLLHNSHSDWSLEPQPRENICITSKTGHELSSANVASIHTWQTAALVLGWLNWQGGCREKEMWCKKIWEWRWRIEKTKTTSKKGTIFFKTGCNATKWMECEKSCGERKGENERGVYDTCCPWVLTLRAPPPHFWIQGLK